MPITLKSHTPLSVRSPYYINCVPAVGTIVSATLVATIQTGDRRSSITSMTDLKSYTLTKTDAVDGIIVFDLSPVVRDFFVHEFLEWTTANYKASTAGQVYFVKGVYTIVNSSGTESPVTVYVTIKDGYANFKDGVNFLPSTGATGDYPFDESVAYDTDVTIMATNCYRQMGTDSYALVAFNLGEFDRKHSETPTYSRIKFGSGSTLWKRSRAANTNVVRKLIPSVTQSPTRYGDINQSIVYIPLGAKNMLTDWIDTKDFLQVGHFVAAQDIGGLASDPVTETKNASSSDFVDNMDGTFTITVDGTPDADQTTMIIGLPDCLPTYSGEGVSNWSILDITGSDITVEAQLVGADDWFSCVLAAGTEDVFYTYSEVTGTDDIWLVNNQDVLRYEILCEPKHNVIDCVFINKWGCWDSFSFLKKSTQKLTTTSSQYKRSIGYVVNDLINPKSYGYSLTDHQKVQYNKNGYKSIMVNTGYVDESFSLLLEEMMLSEKIYLIIDDVVEPVVLNSSSIELKTSVNDKLINYEMEFDFAYNEIQSGI